MAARACTPVCSSQQRHPGALVKCHRAYAAGAKRGALDQAVRKVGFAGFEQAQRFPGNLGFLHSQLADAQ